MSGIEWPVQELSESDFEAILRSPAVWVEQHSEPAEERVRFACPADRKPVVALFPESGSCRGGLDAFVQFAQRLKDARAAAVTLVNGLLDTDPAKWRALIHGNQAYRTIGVVEGLLACAAKTQHLAWRCFELTTLACEVADLIEDSWPPLLVRQIRSEAWREHAWSLLSLGRYPKAEEAARHARALVEDSPTLAIERALADYVLASVFQRLEDNAQALTLARSAAIIFADFGDKQRYVKARLFEGVSLYNAKRFHESTQLWSTLIEEARSLNDRVTLAYLYNNMGAAFGQLNQRERAVWYLGHAAVLYEELGIRTELPRVKLALARVELQRGRFDHALAGFYEARHGFAAVHNGAGVASSELEIVEVLIVTGRLREAKELCADLPAVFQEFGLTQNALTAAAYLREVAAQDVLAVPHVEHVREYLRDLPQNPGREFTRPIVEAGG